MNINDLHKEARQGDKRAREELFSKLSARFNLIATQRIWDRNEVADIVQDAMMVVIRDYERIEFTTSFAAWAHKVLDNKILNYIRKKGLREKITVPMELTEFEEVFTKETDWQGLNDQLKKCLKKILKKNANYGRILNLHYQGYQTDEICEQLQLTSSNAYSILSRARSLLKLCLEKGDIE